MMIFDEVERHLELARRIRTIFS